MENIENKISFRDWLKESVEAGKSAIYRADPIITSTDSGIINKQVFPGIDILTSPGESFLRQLGVSFFPGLTGSFVLPSSDETTAKFVNEAGDASSAGITSGSLTLAARRVSHTQAISKETLGQTSSAVYSGIVQNLVNGLWNCVTNDVFDTLWTDVSVGGSLVISQTTPLTYTQYVAMETSIGGKILASPAYVITPAQRAYQTTNPKMTNQSGVYENGKINGYPAYAVPAQNSKIVSFGDWSAMAVGQWGGLEIIVDPYTDAKKGLINLTIVGLFDTGCFNKARFVNRYDASEGVV